MFPSLIPKRGIAIRRPIADAFGPTQDGPNDRTGRPPLPTRAISRHVVLMSEAGSATVLAELHYADPEAALEWLSLAFGFMRDLVVRNPSGDIVFARTGLANAMIAVLPEQPPRMRSPRATGGVTTQSVQIRMPDDVDAHCARARAAGAVIISEPEDFFFGDRAYLVADIEGHVWNFGQPKSAAEPPPDGWRVDLRD